MKDEVKALARHRMARAHKAFTEMESFFMPPKHRAIPRMGPNGFVELSNLARARAGREIPDVLYEDLCFDAQQAAEKAIKAILVHRQIQFPKTHDIIDLLTLLQKSGMAIPETIQQADLLTGYVETRYPGMSEEVSQEDYVEAVELAERVFRWAESLISTGHESTGDLK